MEIPGGGETNRSRATTLLLNAKSRFGTPMRASCSRN